MNGGISVQENREAIEYILNNLEIHRIMDVGAGIGYYGRVIDNRALVDAIEIWEPAADYLKTTGWYDNVLCGDITDMAEPISGYDMVIFGDVLEHLPLDKAVEAFTSAIEHNDHVFISIPNGEYPQEALYGNEHERHLILNPERDLIPLLPPPLKTFVYGITTTYLW
ncbi:MAG: class I SAM-dependent methyltransferase [Clostridiales bacterium]|jgi:2-polyprenyl-3-methyl-5-hydroxy-6-metoxy-1,4-benzoquinol methylase|nr:class I SAM-dependent methyltransferase [Clostridiales bacterium]